MRIGMNIEAVVDWSPAWMFRDAFQASRPWIAHAIDKAGVLVQWDVAATHPLRVDGLGILRELKKWIVADGRRLRQAAGTQIFRDIGGAYPAGTYRAEWLGRGCVGFGGDARVKTTGVNGEGRAFADLDVTPTNEGLHLLITETDPLDPIRDLHVWMPDWEGAALIGHRWGPGDPDSPFHPLFLERLRPFAAIRFMEAQETNFSTVRGWSDRRTAAAIRQASGHHGSPSEPLVNGLALEYMVRLANDLGADPWFNIPPMADDDFVRRFAEYVGEFLDPALTIYVEWGNEAWNLAPGFGTARCLVSRARQEPWLGRSHLERAGRAAGHGLGLWSEVFRESPERIIRVAGGWIDNPVVSATILASMDGRFDALGIAPYLRPRRRSTPPWERFSSVDGVLEATRACLPEVLDRVRRHRQLADQWSTHLGRRVGLLAYEGGLHLDAPRKDLQDTFHKAANDPRAATLFGELLVGLAEAGVDLYMDYRFTGRNQPSAWGDFAKLHRMDIPTTEAPRYATLIAAARGE